MRAAQAGPDTVRTAGFVVALLGAECSGKTTLAQQLHRALQQQGIDGVVVDEALRTFCCERGRTPTRHEQAGIAQRQADAVADAARRHDVVIADTTALMTAVYSEHFFNDTRLYGDALALQRRCGLTLLCASDLPWQPDGHQRAGEHSRATVDTLLRAALLRSETVFSVISGSGAVRLSVALSALQGALSKS